MGEGGFEGDEVVVEVAARVDLFASVREVRVLAVQLRSGAGEVLRHRRDAVAAEHLSLEPPDVRGDQAGGDFGVGAEGAEDAGPAGLGGQVRRGVQGEADADREVLLTHDVGVAAHEFLVVDGGQAGGFRPQGEPLGVHARRGIVDEPVAGVRGDGHRDPEARRGGQVLKAVVPLGHAARGRRPEQVEVAHQLAGDHRGGGGPHGVVVGCARLRFHEGAVGVDGDHGVEEEATFSSSVMRARRSATRSATGSRGSS